MYKLLQQKDFWSAANFLINMLPNNIFWYALKSDGMWMGSYGSMIQEAKELFGRLEVWQVTHVRRTANSVAHQLSKFALESRGDSCG
jgi:hypothetical protein